VTGTRMLQAAGLVSTLALVSAGGASAGEVVARGVQDGMLALGPRGTPWVAYVRGPKVVFARRVARGRWRAQEAGAASRGSTVMDLAVGAAGPVALVQSADDRRLLLVRRRSVGWQTIQVAAGLPARVHLGWPGLVLNRSGQPIVGYARWNSVSLKSQLLLARIDARGRVRTQAITAEGFPQSAVPPPAAPVLFGGTVHVIESYGYRGVLGTYEWFPQKRTWIGLNIDSGVGDFPLGPVVAGLSPAGILHAAWTESLTFFGQAPVTLAIRRRVASSEFVLDRALTTALVLPRSGPEIAANEWVTPDELGLTGNDYVWAGAIVRGKARVELDGWLAGFALAPRGGRQLLLAGPAGLSWLRSPGPLARLVTIRAETDPQDRVHLSGRVRGVRAGTVTVYRERPGEARQVAGDARIVGGSYSFVDRPPGRSLLYRAVYTDPATGIPYAALLHEPF
jgi:hypothetical protein